MSLTFLNAVLWPLLALLSVPVLLHLFARSRPPAYKFSSVELVQRVIRSTMRIKKPQAWILLILRMLIFLALLLAFLRPLFFAEKRLAGFMQNKNVVLIVDASASMAWSDGAQTRFAAAAAEASEILSGLSVGDGANVIWLRSTPTAVFPQMASNMSYLRTELRQGVSTYEAGDVEGAVKMAVDLLQGRAGKREICIISDFQATNWRDRRLPVPESIDVIKIKVGKVQAANTAVRALYALPASSLVGEEVGIYCEVENFSGRPVKKTVFLGIGETRRTQKIQIPAWSKSVATFRHRFTSPGLNPISASINEDAYPGDDQRWSVLRVSRHLNVAMISAKSATATMWFKAMTALEWVRPQEISIGELHASGHLDAILIPSWNGSNTNSLRHRLQQGCTVICEPGRDLLVSSLRGLAGLDPTKTDGDRVKWEENRKPLSLKLGKANASVFNVFADGEFGDPTLGNYRGRLTFNGDSFPGGEFLLNYEDGVPALMQLRSGGSLFLWNLQLDKQYGSLHRRPEFVALLGEILLASRLKSSANHHATDFLPGEPIIFMRGQEILTADLMLTDDQGQSHPVTQSRQGIYSPPRVSVELPPGIYGWRHQNEPVEYSTVNFPAAESDLRALDRTQIQDGNTITLSGGSKVRELRDGLQLWPYLLAIAVLAAVGEGIVTMWARRR